MGSIVSVFLFPNGSYCYCFSSSCITMNHEPSSLCLPPVSPSLLCVWWLSLSPHSSLTRSGAREGGLGEEARGPGTETAVLAGGNHEVPARGRQIRTGRLARRGGGWSGM